MYVQSCVSEVSGNKEKNGVGRVIIVVLCRVILDHSKSAYSSHMLCVLLSSSSILALIVIRETVGIVTPGGRQTLHEKLATAFARLGEEIPERSGRGELNTVK